MSVILGAPSGFEPTLFPIAAAVSLAEYTKPAIRETLGADTSIEMAKTASVMKLLILLHLILQLLFVDFFISSTSRL